MARTFWDGADVYSAVSQIAVKWQVYEGIALTTGRFGGRAIRIQGNSLARITRTIPATDRHSFGVATLLTGFDRGPTMGAGFFSSTGLVADPTNRQIGYTISDDGTIRVWRGATNLLWQSVPGRVVNAAWVYIGFSAIIHPSAGSWSLTLNGEPVIEQTNVNTQGIAGTNNFKVVTFGKSSGFYSGTYDVDDIYFDDEYISQVPERRIETLYPSADGSPLDLVPSTGTSQFAMIDETLVSATDFLTGSVVGEVSEFELTNLGNVPTVIDGVQASGFAWKTDAATRAFNYGVRSNGVDALGPDIYLGQTMQQGFNNVLLNPDGSVAWTPAAVNAARLRARIAV